MADDPPAQLPSAKFFEKMRMLQKELPPYIAKNGAASLGHVYEELGRDLKAQRFADAEKAVDEILLAIKG